MVERRRRLRPEQYTVCPVVRCGGIAKAARWICPKCWGRLSPIAAARVRRAAAYVRRDDGEMSRMLLTAAKADALRELKEAHRGVA